MRDNVIATEIVDEAMVVNRLPDCFRGQWIAWWAIMADARARGLLPWGAGRSRRPWRRPGASGHGLCAVGIFAEVETAGISTGLTGVFVGEIVDSLAIERIGELLDFIAANDRP